MMHKLMSLLNRDLEEVERRTTTGLSNLKNKKKITVGSHAIKIERKIAEGGYADIFMASDCATRQVYALKRMFIPGIGNAGKLSRDSKIDIDFLAVENNQISVVRRAFECEVEVFRRFPDSDNLLKLVDVQETKKKEGYEVLLLLEFCGRGTLFELIEEKCRACYSGISDERQLF